MSFKNKKSLAWLWLMASLSASLAFAKDDPALPALTQYGDGFAFSLDLTMRERASGLGFEVESPGMLSGKNTNIGFFLGIKDLRIKNMKAKNGELVPSDNLMAQLGINLYSYSPIRFMKQYMKLSAAAASLDSALFDKKIGLGGEVALGIELPYNAKHDTAFGPKTNAFFLEGLYLLGMPTVAKVNGKPDMLNGSGLKFGFKIIY